MQQNGLCKCISVVLLVLGFIGMRLIHGGYPYVFFDLGYGDWPLAAFGRSEALSMDLLRICFFLFDESDRIWSSLCHIC